MTNRKKRWHPAQESDELVFAVCDRFLAYLGKQYASEDEEKRENRQRGAASAVAEWVKRTYGRDDLTRERIYPLFWEAMRRQYLLLRPPRDRLLSRKIVERFALQGRRAEEDAVQVVNVRGADAPYHVSSAAADVIYDLVHRLKGRREKVHIALGAGFSSMMVARRLAQRVYSDLECPPLVLHALSSGGFLADQPYKAPVTYFGYFTEVLPKVEYVGLFSETLVSSQEFDRVRSNPSVHRSFAMADEVDIVMTSFAAANDPHGMLGQFLHALLEDGAVTQQDIDRMKRAGWVGDVQFRPYSARSAIFDECPVRVVTLFEIADLVRLADTPDKYVVLIAGPCSECGMLKTEALLPLMQNPDLRLWTHLVTDLGTAYALLSGNGRA
ncbi:MAG: hypothetical protein GYA33_13705 [Thermogutta sp.]|nr:hypothetical protein [Thermogutta sp.]